MRITGASARRWTVPLAAAAAFVAAGPVAGALTSAHADLPPRSAQQLLVDIQGADLKGLSGTVVETADLGLPALPESLAPAGADPLALLSGSHMLRVWSAGPDASRVALLSSFGESDLVRHGSDVWAWTSSNHQATHWVVPADARGAHEQGRPDTAPAVPMTPQQAADKAIAALDPTTQVTDAGTTTVADRPAYLLQLTPRSTTTLVGSVQIAIDGATHVPTRVQIFPRGSSSPALSIGFTHFDPSTPRASTFDFKPGPGVTVKQGTIPEHTGKPADRHDSHDSAATPPKVTGTGWDSVVVATLPPGALSRSGQAAGLLRTLPTVSGTWGSGHLLQGTLFSVLLTDDGRAAVGAVPPDQLYSALG